MLPSTHKTGRIGIITFSAPEQSNLRKLFRKIYPELRCTVKFQEWRKDIQIQLLLLTMCKHTRNKNNILENMVGEFRKSEEPATPCQGHRCSTLHLPDVEQGATVFQVERWPFLLLFGFLLIFCLLLLLVRWYIVHHKDKGFRRFPAVFYHGMMAHLHLDLQSRFCKLNIGSLINVET